MLAFFLDRDDLHRDVPRDRIELEVVQHGPAQHVGQEDVQRDGRGPELAGQRKALGARGGDDAFEALVARQAQQDARVMRIVLDDQQHGFAVDDVVAVVGDTFFAGSAAHGDRQRRSAGAGGNGAMLATGPV